MIETTLEDRQETIITIHNEGAEDFKKAENLLISREALAESQRTQKMPLVSIVVTCYNHLEEYTKPCIKYLLKHTKNVNYELILLDNGSLDETFNYFKTVPYYPKKIVRINQNKGLCYGMNQVLPYVEGKYVAMLHNDIIVTSNWLYNLIRCMESDSAIGLVVPQSDYVSSHQKANLTFNSLEEMQQKAAIYNDSNPKLWEERMRVVTIGAVFRKSCLDVMGFFDYGFIQDFSDDDLSFRVRRAGYKNMICKDTFVSHIGTAFDKGKELSRTSMNVGRSYFKQKYYGLDPSKACDNYEEELIGLMQPIEKLSQVEVLGIEVKCGTPLLEMKNYLYARSISPVQLSAYTSKIEYYTDLKTICKGEVKLGQLEYIRGKFITKKFNYILYGECIQKGKEGIVKEFLQLLAPKGQLLIKLDSIEQIEGLKKIVNIEKYKVRVNKTFISLAPLT